MADAAEMVKLLTQNLIENPTVQRIDAKEDGVEVIAYRLSGMIRIDIRWVKSDGAS